VRHGQLVGECRRESATFCASLPVGTVSIARRQETILVFGRHRSSTIGTLVLPGLVGNVNMPSNGNRIGSYTESVNGFQEVVGSKHCHSSNASSQAFQITVKGRGLDEDSDSESSCTSEGSSQGSSERMEDPIWFSEGGKRGLSPLSVKALEDVVGQVLKNVRAAGYGEAVCTEFREHFARLPSRYFFPFISSLPLLSSRSSLQL
jgi:hypothetical protein